MSKKFIYIILIVIGLQPAFSQTPHLLHAQVAYDYGYYDSVFTYISPHNSQPEYAELCGKTYFATAMYTQALQCFSLAHTPMSYYYIASIYAIQQQTDSALIYLRKHLLSTHKLQYSTVITNPAFNSISKTQEWREFWKTTYYTELDLLIENIKYSLQNKSMQEIITLIENTTINSDILQAYKSLALAKLGKTKEALSIIQHINLSKSSPELLYITYTTYMELQLFTKAYLVNSQYRELQKNNIPALFDAAQICYELHQYSEAQQLLEYIVSLYYLHDKALFLLSKTNSAQKQYLQALSCINKACEIRQNNVEYLFARATLFEELKQFAQAEIDYNQCLDLQPKTEVYFNRAQVRRMQGNMQGACLDYTKSYKLGNQDALYFKNKYCK
jgi:hypothetical protein